MWRLIKAEFHYAHKLMLLIAGFIIPGAWLYIQSRPSAGISAVLFPLCAGMVLQLLILRSMERRERQHVLLPVSVVAVAWARSLLIVVPVVVIYGAYFILFFVFRNTSPLWTHDIYDMMMFLGLILAGFSLFLLLRDVFLTVFLKYNAAEFDVVILIAVILIVVLGIPIAMTTIWKALSVDALRLSCFLAGLGLIYPAVYSFSRRNTYLN